MSNEYYTLGILGHDIFVDENGEVGLNYTVLEKRGKRNHFIPTIFSSNLLSLKFYRRFVVLHPPINEHRSRIVPRKSAG